MAFRGRYEYSLDPKGRLNIPAKFREIIVHDYNSELVITTSIDGCLDCFPLAEWVKVEEKINALPTSLEIKRFRRLYISGAVECSLDKQGRILLPPSLRSWAGLDREVNNVVIAGQINRLELWSQERWNLETQAAVSSESTEKVTKLFKEIGLAI